MVLLVEADASIDFRFFTGKMVECSDAWTPVDANANRERLFFSFIHSKVRRIDILLERMPTGRLFRKVLGPYWRLRSNLPGTVIDAQKPKTRIPSALLPTYAPPPLAPPHSRRI